MGNIIYNTLGIYLGYILYWMPLKALKGEATLSAGDYDLTISKGNREIKRLFIQDEILMAEFRFVLNA